MADAATELQEALYAILNGAPFQSAIGQAVPVLDHVPGTQLPPYIKIGDVNELGDNAQGYAGSESVFTIGIWTPGPGKLLGKRIAGLMRAAFWPDQRPGGSAPFTLASHRLVTWTFEGAQHLDDVDGVSVKSIVTGSFSTYPTA